MNLVLQQNQFLKELIAEVLQKLPKHLDNCGVHRSHVSYGNKYCDCGIEDLKKKLKQSLDI